MTKLPHSMVLCAPCALRIGAPLSLLCALVLPACSRLRRRRAAGACDRSSVSIPTRRPQQRCAPRRPPPDAAPAVQLARGRRASVHAADGPIVDSPRLSCTIACFGLAAPLGSPGRAPGCAARPTTSVRFGWVAQRWRTTPGPRSRRSCCGATGKELRHADLGNFVGRLRPHGDAPPEFPTPVDGRAGPGDPGVAASGARAHNRAGPAMRSPWCWTASRPPYQRRRHKIAGRLRDHAGCAFRARSGSRHGLHERALPGSTASGWSRRHRPCGAPTGPSPTPPPRPGAR